LQWLFLVDGVISLPIAVLGFVFLPDMPETIRAWYFTEEEKAFGLKRMQLEGRKGRQPYTVAKFKKIFSSWHIYALTLLYIVFNNGGSSSAPVFAQYLKHSENPRYSVSQINIYPTITQAVVVISTLVYARSSDTFLKGAGWPPMIFGAVFNIITCASLAICDVPESWKWACYIMAAFGVGLSGLCFAWAHEIFAKDNEERALVTATMNEMAYVIQAWLPLVMWQQVNAPQYHKGFVGGAVLSGLLIVTALVVGFLHNRELEQK
jgi:ACS family pantothenate transporter-like MFS transporter